MLHPREADKTKGMKTDYRNLIDGKVPEIGNNDHIKEYKRRIDVQDGLQALGENPPTNLTISDNTAHFNCPKCSDRNDIKFPKGDKDVKVQKCVNPKCKNKFLLSYETVFVKSSKISKDDYAEWCCLTKYMRDSMKPDKT